MKEDLLEFQGSRISGAWEEFTFYHAREGQISTSVHMDSITNPTERLIMAQTQVARDVRKLWP